jgi:predicted ester cyclase
MTHDEARTYFERRRQAWHSGNAAALAADHAADSSVSSPMFASIKGRDAILASYQSLFRMFTNWEFQNGEPVIDGDRIALPFSARATHQGEFMGLAGTGRRFSISGVLILQMRDGLIVHEQRFYDFTGLLIQTGVLRSKPHS